jgi:hypothetical protein
MAAMVSPSCRRAALALAAALLLGGCRGAPDDPEAQVRALVRDAVAAAERKDVGALRAMVSERYADDQGQDKRAVEALLRLHFLRNQSIHLYTRIRSVELAPPDRAQASVLVAMAGVPIASEEQLPGVRADLHRFELELAREDGAWRVQRAAWRRTEPGEFLNP